jgi:hypothetical protein
MRILVFTCLILTAVAAGAQSEMAQLPVETSRVFGSYEVFYNVFPSIMLTEQVAAANHIVRGNDRAVINITVRKNLPEGGDRAQTAVVTGTSSDLMQNKKLEFREINEQGEAIYYIAELRHSDRELLRFDIKIQPDPNLPPYTLTFTRKLYQEE